MNTLSQTIVRYRYVGLVGALLLLLMLGRFQLTLQYVVQLALAMVFVVIAYVDWQTRLIPNKLLLPLGLLTLLLIVLHPESAWMRLIGAIFAAAPFMLTAFLRPNEIGGGDIKLVTLMGLLFGFPNIIWALLIAVLSGGLIAVTMLLTKRGTRKTELAYAPFLCFGALVILLVIPLSIF